MELPNYFIADLPSEAVLSPALLSEACQTLKRNRAQYLARRSTEDLVQVIDAIARQWRAPEFPFRKAALERGPGELHFSRITLGSRKHGTVPQL